MDIKSRIQAFDKTSTETPNTGVRYRNSIIDMAAARRSSSAKDKSDAGVSLRERRCSAPTMFQQAENNIPSPGESLNVNPLGSYELKVPFNKVYKLGKMLNEGAFGTVHTATHSCIKDENYAIKVLDREATKDDEIVIEEASILRDVRNLKNVMTIIDFYMDGSNFFVVQELAEGGDVFDRLVEKTTKTYTEDDARELARTLLWTIKSLHDRKLVHRDLKPENLLLKSKKDDASILLCDFGYAKYLPEGGGGLRTGCGTPVFTAPEIINRVEYWTEVDMWSVGCILFMLLGGYQPFDADTNVESYELITAGDWDFGESEWDTVSSEAKSLISNLLQLDRAKRFTAAQALESDWIHHCSAAELQSNDLWKTLEGIKNYCENRPQEKCIGFDETKIVEKISKKHNVPLPGESLWVTPLGSYELKVPFDHVYPIEDILNEGAFGTVHTATHSFIKGEKYAIKVIDREMTNDDEIVIEEASILRDVRNLQNIMTIIDFYMDDNNMYVVQELAEGGDVFDRLIEKTTYTEEDARKLAKTLLLTIKSLHDRKLVHRDLKPENLLLKSKEDDADILLCDFGFAKYLPEGGGGLRTNCGTPIFTAPEIIKGVEYWTEVDMWGVGCILFMLLGGYQPFDADSDDESYELIVSGGWDFDDPAWETVSSEAKILISNLLQVDGTRRFTTAQALESDWIHHCSAAELQSNDLWKTLEGIKQYCENVRPEGICYGFDEKKIEVKICNKHHIPLPGESLKSTPLGSYELEVPFDNVYQLVEILNEGAFGTVYAAIHTCVKGELYAIKVINREAADDDEIVIEEASILRDVRHLQNIMTIIDFYIDESNLYVVQELAEGGDVFDRLVEKTTYTEEDARKLAMILLLTIKSLHDKKLVHRDLKPENLLLKSKEDDADILLCDFGFAKYLPEGGGGLRTNCGTPIFTAPEIIKGVEYWTEVDMWGVGCILFMLLGGYQPFDADSDDESYELIVSGGWDFDDPAWETVSSEAKILISNLLQVDREKRCTVAQALGSEWILNCSSSELESNDLWKTLDGIKNYCENVRPEGPVFGFEEKKIVAKKSRKQSMKQLQLHVDGNEELGSNANATNHACEKKKLTRFDVLVYSDYRKSLGATNKT